MGIDVTQLIEQLNLIYVRRDGTSTYLGTGIGYKDEDTLVSDLANATGSQQSIKAYVDALLAYILASEVGTLIYVWQDFEGTKFLERLVPGFNGQILVTGGANQRPYWDWLRARTDVFIRIWLDAYVKSADIITFDKTKSIQVTGMDIVQRNNVDDLTYFYGLTPELSINLVSAIITVDKTKSIQVDMDVTDSNVVV